MKYPWKMQKKKLRIPNSHFILQKKKNAAAFYAQPVFHGIIYLASQKNVFGMPWIEGTVSYHDALAFWTHNEKETEELNKKITDFIIKKPKHIFDLKVKFDKESEEFLKFIETKVDKIKDENNKKKLYEFFAEFHDHYENTYIYGEPIVWPIKDTIFEMLKKKYEYIPIKDFNVMLTSEILTFTQKEKLSLLKVAFSDNKDKDLQKHSDNFSWIPFDYGVATFDENYFKKELDKLMKVGTERMKEEVYELENFKEITLKKQAEINEKYDVKEKYQKLFKVLRVAAYLMDYKKEVFTKVHVAVIPAQEKLAKIAGMELTDSQYILPNELYEFLVEGKELDKKKIIERKNGSIFWINNHENIIYYDEGPEVRENLGKFLETHDVAGSVSELKGMTAHPGKIKGRARIIESAHHTHELQEGEILITAMTSPDFMMAIKKASAIVTDEGGITCHAAIVSRELKIPCIVGTKNATKVFENDDIIEVDANKGIVRKIK
ncbi:MAG: hypothetical protein ISS25_02610 [Nanoarchaeota archaeon]|nr:hypothetical protein [DPANN group archaeon]MBL7116695.1 hypothetical protein [Nanoarchaeota archaeon]